MEQKAIDPLEAHRIMGIATLGLAATELRGTKTGPIRPLALPSKEIAICRLNA